MKYLAITCLIILVCVAFVYDRQWSGGSKGQKNIENCLSLEMGMSKKQVIDTLGEPSSTHQDGLSLQYYPTSPYSSCQVVLTFQKGKNGNVRLIEKFCDDGEFYVCNG